VEAYIKKVFPENDQEITMKKILNERYITLFMQTSTYNDMRRLATEAGGANAVYSNWLGLSPPKDANKEAGFPKRFPPPVDEETLNEVQLNISLERAGLEKGRTDNSGILQKPIDWVEKAVPEESGS
jgi:hypothetical protein